MPSSVLVFCTAPVLTLRASTSAPLTTAPLGSVTLPVRDPYRTCACATDEARKEMRSREIPHISLIQQQNLAAGVVFCFDMENLRPSRRGLDYWIRLTNQKINVLLERGCTLTSSRSFLPYDARGRSKLFLEHQCHCSPQASHTRLYVGGPNPWRRPRQHARRHFRFDDWTEPRPLLGKLADNDNFLWSQPCNDHSHASANRVGHLLQRSHR